MVTLREYAERIRTNRVPDEHLVALLTAIHYLIEHHEVSARVQEAITALGNTYTLTEEEVVLQYIRSSVHPRLILPVISQNPGLRHKDLSEAVDIRPNALTSAMKHLVDHGLVRRFQPTNKEVYYYLTRLGERMVHSVLPGLPPVQRYAKPVRPASSPKGTLTDEGYQAQFTEVLQRFSRPYTSGQHRGTDQPVS